MTTADGQPASGVPVDIALIGHPRDQDNLTLYHCDVAKEIFPTTLVTDSNGELIVTNLPPRATVYFDVDQQPFAPTRWQWDLAADQHTATVAKGRVVSGVVVAADTGQSLAQTTVKAPWVTGTTEWAEEISTQSTDRRAIQSGNLSSLRNPVFRKTRRRQSSAARSD